MTAEERAEAAHQRWREECRRRTAKLVGEWWRAGLAADQSKDMKIGATYDRQH